MLFFVYDFILYCFVAINEKINKKRSLKLLLISYSYFICNIRAIIR